MGAGAGAVALASGLSLRSALAAARVKPNDQDALLVIDVQNCFVPGGSLAVKEGDQIVPLINQIAKAFHNVVLTQDWHSHRWVSERGSKRVP